MAALVAQGLSNSQIAATLVISARTVETHVQHIMNKLGCSTRAQIAAWSAARQYPSRLHPGRPAPAPKSVPASGIPRMPLGLGPSLSFRLAPGVLTSARDSWLRSPSPSRV